MSEGFIAKYSSSGSFQWVESIQYANFRAIAFSSSQSRVYLAGTLPSSGNIDFDPTSGFLLLDATDGRSFIASYSLGGSSITAKNFGENSEVRDVSVDPNGNVYITGQIGGSNAIFNPTGSGTSFDAANGGMFIAKYTAGLSLTSAVQVMGNSNDFGTTIVAPANDQIIYGGMKAGNLYIARRNSSFGLSWDKPISSSGVVTGIAVNGSDIYISASVASTSVNLGNGVVLTGITSGDISLFRINTSTGLASWATKIVLDTGGSLSIATSGSYFLVSGFFYQSSDFNACFNSTSITANSQDAFLVKYSGNPWSTGIGPINGPSQLCLSSKVYSLQNIPAGTPSSAIQWSVSPTSLFYNDTGQGPSFTTRATSSSSSGQGTITATVQSDCGNYVVNKSVSVGTTYVYFSYNGPGPLGQLDVSVYGGTSPYYFYRNGTLIYTWNLADATIPFGCDGGTLTVEASTSCASSSQLIPAGCPPYFMVVYPNPATSEINITETQKAGLTESSIESSTTSMEQSEIFLELRNDIGNIVQSTKINSSDDEKKISVSGLQKGTYYLRILSNEIDETHRVVLE